MEVFVHGTVPTAVPLIPKEARCESMIVSFLQNFCWFESCSCDPARKKA